MKRRRGSARRDRLDTPEASPVRVTDTTTGETRTDPPLTKARRHDLARSHRKHLSTQRRNLWKTPSE